MTDSTGDIYNAELLFYLPFDADRRNTRAWRLFSLVGSAVLIIFAGLLGFVVFTQRMSSVSAVAYIAVLVMFLVISGLLLLIFRRTIGRTPSALRVTQTGLEILFPTGTTHRIHWEPTGYEVRLVDARLAFKGRYTHRLSLQSIAPFSIPDDAATAILKFAGSMHAIVSEKPADPFWGRRIRVFTLGARTGE
jgi:hypothetical protein